MSREDPFGGAWKLNSEKSRFDPNHRPTGGTMRWERTSDGYRMRAEGICDGRVVEERPQTFILDGQEHSGADAPGVTAVFSRPDPNTIQGEAKHAGRVVGKVSYVVSEDGTTLTASASGTDGQERPFQTVVVFDRLRFTAK
jgi:hypothetical protein